MSRNVRHKSSPPPAQKTPQKSSQQTQDSSSDDDYGGVEDISGGEEDEPNVEVAEERAIISSEDDDLHEIPRPNVDDGQEWEGFPFEPEPVLGGEVPFFDEQMARGETIEYESDSDSVSDEENTPNQKHVRFMSPMPESETMDESENDDMFPDIFLDKSELDPAFLLQLEQEAPDFNSDDGFWDYKSDADVENDADADDGEDEDDISDSSSGSSGYDTDEEGETTDEDFPVAPRKFLPPARSVLRHPSNASSSEEEITVVRRQVQRTPKLASWVHDSDKPYAMAGTDSTRIKIFNMKEFRERRMAPVASSPQSAAQYTQSSPMISNSGNIMMSAMNSDPFQNNQYISGQAVGPIQAFYPFTYINTDGTYAQDSSSVPGSDYDDEELWNLEDIVNFGDTSGDENGGEAEHSSDSPTTYLPGSVEPSSTPARPTTARSEDQVHPLLDHFSNGTVGSFRFNQNLHTLINRSTVSRDSLAFGSAHLEGTIRGVKTGRLQHANTPITPVRKPKTRPILHESSPASPLASFTQMSKKRRFDDEERVGGHKRNKSLV